MPRRSLPPIPPFLCGVLQSAGITAAFVAFGLASAGLFGLLDARVEAVELTGWRCPASRPAVGPPPAGGPSVRIRAILRGNPHPTWLKWEAHRDRP
jgi:hypothetical protein